MGGIAYGEGMDAIEHTVRKITHVVGLGGFVSDSDRADVVGVLRQVGLTDDHRLTIDFLVSNAFGATSHGFEASWFLSRYEELIRKSEQCRDRKAPENYKFQLALALLCALHAEYFMRFENEFNTFAEERAGQRNLVNRTYGLAGINLLELSLSDWMQRKGSFILALREKAASYCERAVALDVENEEFVHPSSYSKLGFAYLLLAECFIRPEQAPFLEKARLCYDIALEKDASGEEILRPVRIARAAETYYRLYVVGSYPKYLRRAKELFDAASRRAESSGPVLSQNFLGIKAKVERSLGKLAGGK